MSNTLRILVTGVGGPTPRSFARALINLSQYKNYELIGTDIHKYAVGLYHNNLFKKTYVTPKSSDPGYWEVTEDLINKHNIDMAVILPETEVYAWSKRKAEGSLPCKALIPDREIIEAVLDKAVLTDHLAPYGLVPKSVVIDINEKGLEAKVENELGYPFWVRSATGSSGLGSFKVNDFSELIKWISINQGVKKFLASEYLEGRNLACKFLYYEGKLLRTGLAERVNYIMAKTAPSGITGNTSFGRLLNDDIPIKVAKQAMEVILEKSKGNLHGFFTVDLKEDKNGKPYVTEINVRHVAFTSSFARGGANFCEDTIRLLDGDPSFDKNYNRYRFADDLIFLREVDALPVVMKESALLENVYTHQKNI